MEATKTHLRAMVKEVKAAVQVRDQTAAGEAGVIETPSFKPRSVADIMIHEQADAAGRSGRGGRVP
jgi:hypothetical protein